MGDKVYAFDLDSTLIKTRSGGTFSKNAEDWKWCFDTVLAKLEEISKANGTIVIFSNQAGVLSDKRESKSMYHFLLKVKSILLDLNKHGIGSKVWIYASTGQSALSKKKGIDPKRFTKYRKPAVGMFEDFEKEYNNLKKEQLKNENVVFIGDAAGREGDFSDSDLKFAKNCRVEFRIPEDFF
jgi:polynucleotide 3'-phosphatase